MEWKYESPSRTVGSPPSRRDCDSGRDTVGQTRQSTGPRCRRVSLGALFPSNTSPSSVSRPPSHLTHTLIKRLEPFRGVGPGGPGVSKHTVPVLPLEVLRTDPYCRPLSHHLPPVRPTPRPPSVRKPLLSRRVSPWCTPTVDFLHGTITGPETG